MNKDKTLSRLHTSSSAAVSPGPPSPLGGIEMEGAALHAVPQWQMAPQQAQFAQAQAQYAMAAPPPPGVGAFVPHHQMSARTAMLARKVAEAKAKRLGCFEHFLSKSLGTLVLAPSGFLGGFVSVQPNNALAVFRFGKLDRMITRPGLYWLPTFFENVTCFTGTQTHKMDEL